jgi:hypothetical protein
MVKNIVVLSSLVATVALAGSGCVIKAKQKQGEPEPAQQQQEQTQTPPPAAYVPPAPAMTSFGPGCTVGWTATQEMEMTGGMKMTTYWAIVGDMGQNWFVEHIPAGFPAGEMLALTVEKATGRVLSAKKGKAGEAGVDHPIAQYQEVNMEGTPENVTIRIGSFPAKKIDMGGGNLSWIGTEGDMKGVLLKVAGAAPYELSAPPTSEFVPCAGTSIGVHKYKYSNGMTQIVTNDRIIAAFFPYEVGKRGLYGMEMEGMKSKITAMGSSARPQMIW